MLVLDGGFTPPADSACFVWAKTDYSVVCFFHPRDTESYHESEWVRAWVYTDEDGLITYGPHDSFAALMVEAGMLEGEP